MRDRCVITRDPEATDDDALDPNTGVLTPPAADRLTVYDHTTTGDHGRRLHGRCVVVRITGRAAERSSEGAAAFVAADYRVGLPWDAPVPLPGDEARMTLTADALLSQDDAVLRVVQVDAGSNIVQRSMVCELRRLQVVQA